MPGTLTDSPKEQQENALNILFSEEDNLADADKLVERIVALENLAVLFLHGKTEVDDLSKLSVNYPAARLFIGRFVRDAYGVCHAHKTIQQLEEDKGITLESSKTLRDTVARLGIRINTDKPRKTRIAAAFTLWMMTMRPVMWTTVTSDEFEMAGRFPAAFTFWIVQSFLGKFGTVSVGNQHTYSIRMERIIRDFTYRAVNLSSLEMLYCSIFTPNLPEDGA